MAHAARRSAWLSRPEGTIPTLVQVDSARVRRAMIRLDVQEHVTFGGCLEEGAKGFIARKIVSSGKGRDFHDFNRIEAWAARIGSELVKESPRS